MQKKNHLEVAITYRWLTLSRYLISNVSIEGKKQEFECARSKVAVDNGSKIRNSYC